MPVRAACPCGQQFMARDDLAGKRVNCPSCGQPFQVPAAALPVVAAAPATSASDILAQGAAGTATPQPARQPVVRQAPQKPVAATMAPSSSGVPGWARPVAVAVGALTLATLLGVGLWAIIAIVRLELGDSPRRSAAARGAGKRPSGVGFLPSPSRGNPMDLGGGDGWYTHNSDDGRYTVEMPDTPEFQTKTEMTPGGMLTTHIAACEDTTGAYLAGHTFMPVNMTRQEASDGLQSQEDFILRNMSGQLVTSRTLLIQGFPAREIRFQGRTGGRSLSGMVRYVIAGNRLYQMMWIGPRDNVPMNDIRRMFDSFEISDAETLRFRSDGSGGIPPDPGGDDPFAPPGAAGGAGFGGGLTEPPSLDGPSFEPPSFEPPSFEPPTGRGRPGGFGPGGFGPGGSRRPGGRGPGDRFGGGPGQ